MDCLILGIRRSCKLGVNESPGGMSAALSGQPGERIRVHEITGRLWMRNWQTITFMEWTNHDICNGKALARGIYMQKYVKRTKLQRFMGAPRLYRQPMAIDSSLLR